MARLPAARRRVGVRGFSDHIEGVSLSRSDLVALSRKYRALAELGRATHGFGLVDARLALRQLTAEFPGALRELEVLPLREIEQRQEAVERAARRGVAEPWMEWMVAYHRVMRAALMVKRRLGGHKNPPELEAVRIANAVAAECGYGCDVAFVRAVARPPGGRLSWFAFQRVEVEYRVAEGQLGRVLFPDARPGHG